MPSIPLLPPYSVANKNEVRKALRQKRRAISPEQRRQAAAGLVEQVRRWPAFRRSQRIAFYIANDGEISVEPLLRLAANARKQCFLPVLHGPASNRLWFAPYAPGEALVPNRFGIPEPTASRAQFASVMSLDLVLMPLVAFDDQGRRLGMGGGFYDRTFAYLRHRRCWRKPTLVGVAYDFQQIPSVPDDPWDIPLTAIATQTRLIDTAV